MEDHDKVYGFTITMYEYRATIPTLWETVRSKCLLSSIVPQTYIGKTDFMKEYPQYISPDNAMAYMSEDGGESYNLCHCT